MIAVPLACALLAALAAGCGEERVAYHAEFDPGSKPAEGRPVLVERDEIGEVREVGEPERGVNPTVPVELALDSDAPPLRQDAVAITRADGSVVIDPGAPRWRVLPPGSTIPVARTMRCPRAGERTSSPWARRVCAGD